MNKYLGQIMTMLYEPAKPDGGAGGGGGPGGDIYSQIDAAADGAQGADETNSGKPAEGADGGDEQDRNGSLENDGDKGEDTDFGDKKPEGQEGEEKPDGEEKPEGEEKPAPMLRLDPETIAQLRGDRAQREEPEGDKLSSDQIKAMLNPVEVTDQLVAELRSEDPKVAREAQQKLQLATVKNAVSITRVLINNARKEVEKALAPLMQHQQTTQLTQTRSEFYSANKDLAKYDKVVKAVTAELGEDPAAANMTKAQIFKEVSKRARAELKGMGINLAQPANLGAQGGKTVPKPNGVAPGGRSGGDSNGQGGKQNNPDADIYSKTR